MFLKNFGANYQKSEEVLKYQNRRAVDNFDFMALSTKKRRNAPDKKKPLHAPLNSLPMTIKVNDCVSTNSNGRESKPFKMPGKVFAG